MTLPLAVQAALLFAAALAGGAMNSVAGGGSFLVFPALVMTGVAPINANATTTVALWPGSIASVGAYRSELSRARHARLFSLISLAGGVAGAVLLLHTPSATFSRLIPFLLLLATLLFAFSGRITTWLRAVRGKDGASPHQSLLVIAALQFIISVYGGFFGAGIGILMLAMLGLMGMENIHEMNALKTLLASCINGIAVVTFVVAQVVVWPQAILMLIGSVAGGYGGARLALRVEPRLVRRLIIAIGLIMTAYFFARLV